MQLSAVHDKEDMDQCIDAFVRVSKAKGVI